VPEWTRSDGEASISLEWASSWPWDEGEETRQVALLSSAANQFVNSLRPRLARLQQ